MSFHTIGFVGIDGTPLPLSQFAGRPVLVVNTASECGFTGQYAGLQRLWERWRDRGLVVIGVPCDDFGGQEPGDDAAVLRFCRSRYGVDFPLSRKERVIGDAAHPFWRRLVDELGEDQAPRWNFHKVLIAPDGTLAGVWPSRVEPLDPELVATVEDLLADE